MCVSMVVASISPRALALMLLGLAARCGAQLFLQCLALAASTGLGCGVSMAVSSVPDLLQA